MQREPVTPEEWKAAQLGEAEYWGDQALDNVNVQQEIKFQQTYATYMGLSHAEFGALLEEKDVIDIGGGPVSMLLKRKVKRSGKSVVVDPLPLTPQSIHRYLEHQIFYWAAKAENALPILGDKCYDEAWLYNCLAHVTDPEFVLKEAKRISHRLRIFEVLHTGTDYMHPWSFDREFFDNILGEGGSTITLTEPGGVIGEAYYGIFNFSA